MSISIKESGQFDFIGDEFRVGQVFSILIENMLRYCNQGDRMRICLERTTQEIVLVFQDTGLALHRIICRRCLSASLAVKHPARAIPAAAGSGSPLRRRFALPITER